MLSKLALLFCLPIVLMAESNPFVDAGKTYNIDPWLLYSIAKVESNNNPNAINYNRNGTVDVGVMQVNSCHLPLLKKYGYTKEDLWNPQVNITLGAWVLAGCVARHGYTTNALNCYNGDKTGRYSKRVMNMFHKEMKEHAQK